MLCSNEFDGLQSQTRSNVERSSVVSSKQGGGCGDGHAASVRCQRMSLGARCARRSGGCVWRVKL
jgi:hypothetical protein